VVKSLNKASIGHDIAVEGNGIKKVGKVVGHGGTSTVTATLAAMVHNLTLAVGNLKKLEPGGELEKAFHEAPACAPYFAA